jgi:hypothetical protein
LFREEGMFTQRSFAFEKFKFNEAGIDRYPPRVPGLEGK